MAGRSITLTANITYSKHNDPACFMEEVTFTCSIVGRNLLWFLNNNSMEPLKTYNADDSCGNFTHDTRDNYSFDFLLGSNIATGTTNESDGFYNCTSLMGMTANMPGPVTIHCLTMDPQNNIKNDSISFEVLGM